MYSITVGFSPTLYCSPNVTTIGERTRLNAMKRFCIYLQPMIPPKRFDIFSPLTGGCSEGLGAFCFFFKIRIPRNPAQPCRANQSKLLPDTRYILYQTPAGERSSLGCSRACLRHASALLMGSLRLSAHYVLYSIILQPCFISFIFVVFVCFSSVCTLLVGASLWMDVLLSLYFCVQHNTTRVDLY